MVYASKILRVDVTHIRRERVYEWNCPDGMSERQEGYRYYEEALIGLANTDLS